MCMHVCVCVCAHTRARNCSLANNFLKHVLGPPGGTVARNSPANAGDTGMIPGLGRFHMPWATQPQPLGLCAAATEARTPRAWAPQQEKSLQWEAHAPPAGD